MPFNVDLVELGEAVQTRELKLKRRGNKRPTAEGNGSLAAPEFKATRAWLDVAPLYMKRGRE